MQPFTTWASPSLGHVPKTNQGNYGDQRRKGSLCLCESPLAEGLKNANITSINKTFGVPLPGLESEILPFHPKLEREIYRGYLQEEIAGKLAAEDDGRRRVGLVGNSLVDIETGEILDAEAGKNPELFIAAMHALVVTPGLRDQLGARAKRQASNFSWQSTAQRIADIYQDVLTRPRYAQ